MIGAKKRTGTYSSTRTRDGGHAAVEVEPLLSDRGRMFLEGKLPVDQYVDTRPIRIRFDGGPERLSIRDFARRATVVASMVYAAASLVLGPSLGAGAALLSLSVSAVLLAGTAFIRTNR